MRGYSSTTPHTDDATLEKIGDEKGKMGRTNIVAMPILKLLLEWLRRSCLTEMFALVSDGWLINRFEESSLQDLTLNSRTSSGLKA